MPLKLQPAIAEIDPRTDGPRRGPDDPLLNAVIWKLPDIGQPFTAAARRKWLELVAMAFDVAYGPEDLDVAFGGPTGGAMTAQPSAPAAPEKPAPRPPHVAAGCDVYVDVDGFARCDVRKDDHGRPSPTPQRRVLAEEVEGEQIYDYRGERRDRSTVTWADDMRGAQPGMEFCGPG